MKSDSIVLESLFIQASQVENCCTHNYVSACLKHYFANIIKTVFQTNKDGV